MDKSFFKILVIFSICFSNVMIVHGCCVQLRSDTSLEISKDISPMIPTTGPTILDWYSTEMQVSAQLSISEDQSLLKDKMRLCPNSRSGLFKDQVLDGIERSLKFYEAHMDLVDRRLDSLVGLLVLREIDNKLGKRFQKTFPIEQWLMDTCVQISKIESIDGKTCQKLVQSKRAPSSFWKPNSILEGHLETLSLLSVGTEGEDLWGINKRGCIRALVNNCEVPFICGRSLGDPTPRSQYFLTHQVLFRILAEQMGGCAAGKSLTDEQVNHQLCAKMYQEAELVANLNYSVVHRHLFSEYVGFCGYMGYPNFLREDWLQNLLSWQSRSGYGCFTVGKEAKNLFMDEDGFITRRPTPTELKAGLPVDKEECVLQSTTTGLFALAVHWEYLEENC